MVPVVSQLTEQQQRIHELVEQGFKRREIVKKLSITVDTFKSQMKRIRTAKKEKGGTESKKYPRVNSVLRTTIIDLYNRGHGKTEIVNMLGLTMNQVWNTINRYVTNEDKRNSLVANREKRCISTELLAAESGVSHQEIIDIENGTLIPAKKVLKKLNTVIFIKHNKFPKSPVEELAELIKDKNLMAAVRSVYGGGT